MNRMWRRPFFGNEFLDFVGEEYHAYLVIVLYSREGQRRGYFGYHFSLVLAHGTEVAATRHIDKKHHGELALFLEDLDIGMVVTGGHVPVDVADVVAVLIFAHLAEHHAATLERRVVLTGEYVLRQTLGLDLDFSYFLKKLVGIHKRDFLLRVLYLGQGFLEIISSAVMVLASAS